MRQFARDSRDMRSLFFLTMGAVMLLGIDAAEFNSHYRKAAWHELSRQGRMLQYKAERSVDFF
jgi:hypothetical protein